MKIGAVEVGKANRRFGSSPKCFLHIPKCGGVSIHTSIETALPPESMAPQRFDASVFCDFKDFDLLGAETRSEIVANQKEAKSLARFRVVSGHFSLPTLLQITGVSSIATVLREPRTRLLSLYLYWRTPKIFERWTPYRADTHALRPLAEFLSEPCLAPVTDNQICRLLLQGDPRIPESKFIAASEVEGIAEEAADRMDELGFVGVLELGDSVWRGISRFFEVGLQTIESNVTGEDLSPTPVSSGEKLMTADALDLIDQRNVADLLVYEQVLVRAGLSAREREKLMDGAFAQQLVKLGDLIGHSASRAAAQVMIHNTGPA